MATWQTPRPFIPGYRKLADFVRPQEPDLPETQEISVVPRMKLPTVDTATGEIVVPWVTAWSNKAEILPVTPYKGIEQASTSCTPLPEMLSDIATLHLSTPKHSEETLQVSACINIFVYTKNGELVTAKNQRVRQRTGSIWKYFGAIIPRFGARIFAPFFAKVPESPAELQVIQQKNKQAID